jgi:hypothetical protein
MARPFTQPRPPTHTPTCSTEYEALCKGLRNPTPPPITDDLSRWMSEAQWASLDVLGAMPAFGALAKDMEKMSDDWSAWYVQRVAGCNKPSFAGAQLALCERQAELPGTVRLSTRQHLSCCAM